MPVASTEEVERFALVMVHPTREEDGSLTHILHTLLPEERPIEVRACVCLDLRKYSPSIGQSNIWPNRSPHPYINFDPSTAGRGGPGRLPLAAVAAGLHRGAATG